MPALLLDAQGRPVPQILKRDGTAYISWQGDAGAGDVNVKEMPAITGTVEVTAVPNVTVDALPNVVLAGTPGVNVQNAIEVSNFPDDTFEHYEAGAEATTDAFLVTDVTPSHPLQKMKVYVKTDSFLTCNLSTNEIFLPANTWTQVDVKVESFNIKTITGTDTAYWQGVHRGELF